MHLNWKAIARLLASLFRSRRSLQAIGLVVAECIVLAYFAVKVDHFWEADSLLDLLRQGSITILLSVGMTFVILTAGIDLSVGSILCLSAIVVALGAKAGLPLVVAAMFGVVVGALCGALNGALIVAGRLSPFIVTLGGLWAIRGVARWLSDDRSHFIADKGFREMYPSAPMGIPLPAIIAFSVVILAEIVLRRTRYGRSVFAVGGSQEASWLAGIRVGWTKLSVYAISGLMAGLGAVLLASKLGSGTPTAGNQAELDAIAAAVLGGTSLMGGEGSALGTLVGAIFIQTLRKGMSMMPVSDYKQHLIIGSAIIVGALLDQLLKRR